MARGLEGRSTPTYSVWAHAFRRPFRSQERGTSADLRSRHGLEPDPPPPGTPTPASRSPVGGGVSLGTGERGLISRPRLGWAYRRRASSTFRTSGGFDAARGRFATSHPASDEAFHGIFEVLAWTGALRERLGNESPLALEGLWYVRNLVLHQGTDILEWIFIPGAELGTLVLGVSRLGTSTTKGWWFQPRAVMPEPRSR